MPSTPATRALQSASAAFTIHSYVLDSHDGSYGEAVARELDVDPDRLFKTLVTEIDEVPSVAVIPVSAKLNLKKLAAAALAKRARMAEPVDAERWTGYVTGGISPFGQKRPLPVFVDQTAILHETVLASGGKRGLQIEFSPGLFSTILNATLADLVE